MIASNQKEEKAKREIGRQEKETKVNAGVEVHGN